MPEGVLEIGEEPALVEELGGLEGPEPATEDLLGRVGDRLEQGEGHVLADDGRRLQEPLVLGREPVDARGQDGLGRGRNLEALGRLRQAIRPPLARQDPRLDERPDALLEEERVPLGSLDQEPLEGLDGRVVAE
jgi:hypothetical protein